MKKLLIFMIAILLILSLSIFVACPTGPDGGDGGDGGDDGDTEAPVITDFTLTSPDPTSDLEITFTLDATDNVGVTGWLVNENSTPPASDDDAWLDNKPTEYLLSGEEGTQTIYAWAKDDAGNVSESTSDSNFDVTFESPEDLVNWNKKIDGGVNKSDSFNAVAVDSSDNVYVVGYGYDLTGTDTYKDIWIKKFDSQGNEETTNWNKMIEISGATASIPSEEAHDVVIDSSDNVYVVGYGTDLVASGSGKDWFIKKYDANGVEDTANWDKMLDSGSNGWDEAMAVAIDNTGNIYVAGFGFDMDGSSDKDWWIKKFDSSGTELWDESVNVNDSYERIEAIAFDSSNNAYFAGFGDSIVTSSSQWDMWLRKYDDTGTLLKNIKIDRLGNEWEYAYSIEIDDSDNVYVGGYAYELISGTSKADMWLQKFTTDLDDNSPDYWDVGIDGGPGDQWDKIYGVAVDSAGDIYVGGGGKLLDNSNSGWDWAILKFDDQGNEYTDWNFAYDGGTNGDDEIYDVAVDSTDAVYFVGYGTNLVGADSSADGWIKKFPAQ
jgi:hypothetical protein